MSNFRSIFPLLICFAVNAIALTSGPYQIEFTEYVSPARESKVNPLTGDYTYNIPLGTVKSANGTEYPVNVGYQSGIKNEQQASWVGLGWSLNAGAISRYVVGNPDDYRKSAQATYMHAEGIAEQYYEGLGISIPIGIVSVGLSFEKNNPNEDMKLIGGSIGISIKTVSFSIGYGENGPTTSVSAGIPNTPVSVGIYAGEKNTGFFAGVAGGILKAYTGTNGIGINLCGIAGFNFDFNGFYAYAGSANSYRYSGASNSGTDVEVLRNYLLSENLIYLNILSIRFKALWAYNNLQSFDAAGYLYQSPYAPSVVLTDNPILAKVMNDAGNSNWKYKLPGQTYDEIRHTDLDINDRLESINDGEYSFSSPDIYQAKAFGLGGVFRPYAYNSMQVLYDNEDGEDSKVGLMGTLNGNDYGTYYNENNRVISSDFSKGITFKFMGEAAYNVVDNVQASYNTYDDFQPIDNLKNKITGTRIEPVIGGRPGLEDKLMGFVITDQQGKSYYFSEPLLSLQTASYVSTDQAPSPSRFNECRTEGGCATQQDYDQYATTWLLTAITGPDYIKRKYISSDELSQSDYNDFLENLRPHEGDFGYWISFRYSYGAPVTVIDGVPSDDYDDLEVSKTTYPWAIPYDRPEILSKNFNALEGPYRRTFGLKEMTYLKSIETSSEIAYFRTSTRLDGQGLELDENYPRMHDFIPIPYGNVTNIVNEFGKQKFTGSIFCDRNSACLLPRIAPSWTNFKQSGKKLDDCLIVEIDNDGNLDHFDFEGKDEGFRLANLNFKVQVQYKSRCRNRTWTKTRKSQMLTVIKQSSNWQIDPITRDVIAPDGFYPSPKADEHSTPVSPDSYCRSSYIPYAACIYAENDLENNKLKLYVVGYDHEETNQSNKVWIYRTGVSFSDWTSKKGKVSATYEPFEYSKLDFDYGVWTSDIWDRNRDKNTICRFTKKLDEIAWYSKAEYPWLNGTSDPGMIGSSSDLDTWSDYPLPHSFKRVKFRYNYELAPYTKYSSTSGRLTLKEIRQENGPEYESVSMPPYLFNYNLPDSKYFMFETADPWGFPYILSTDELPNINEPLTGTQWNLNDITTPTCNNIKIDYERDSVYSSIGSMYVLGQKNKNINKTIGDAEEVFPPDEGNTGDCYEIFNIDINSINNNEFTVVENTDNLSDGVLGFIYYYKNMSYPDCKCLYDEGSNPYKDIHKAYYLYKVVDIDNSTKKISLGNDLPAGLGDATTCKFYALKKRTLYCGNVRVKSIENKSLSYHNKLIYKYPQSGVLEQLTLDYIPAHFKIENTTNVENSCEAGVIICENFYEYSRYLSNDIHTNSIKDHYKIRIDEVMYPVVQEYFVDPSSTYQDPPPLNGKRVYYFHTQDKPAIVYNSSMLKVEKPVLEEIILANSATIPGQVGKANVRKIIDRSGIIGQLTKFELIDNSGNVIYSEQNNFAYSEDLKDISGTFYKTLDGALTLDKPLGLKRERVLRRDYTNNQITSITDMITTQPFLVKTSTIKENIKNDLYYGLFDAATGKPSTHITANSTNLSSNKMVSEIPYTYLLGSSSEDLFVKSIIESKNQISLPGAILVSETGSLSFPNSIQSIINNINQVEQTFDISCFSANRKDWSSEEITSNSIVPFPQNRFFEHGNYSWKGGSLVFAEDSYWRNNGVISTVDNQLRPVMTLSRGDLIPSVVIFHPKSNMICGTIKNADINECGIYTCDYNELDPIYSKVHDVDSDGNPVYDESNDPVYRIIASEGNVLDSTYGWKIDRTNDNNNIDAECSITSSNKHFGMKSLYIKMANGIQKNIKIEPGKAYVISAWVNVISGSAKINAVLANSSQPVPWPTFDDGQLIETGTPYEAIRTVTGGEWKLISLKIHNDQLDQSVDWYLKIKIGDGVTSNNTEFYVDDIRVHPENSIVNTFYYDHEKGLALTQVDANNNGSYIRYDIHNRKAESGIITN